MVTLALPAPRAQGHPAMSEDLPLYTTVRRLLRAAAAPARTRARLQAAFAPPRVQGRAARRAGRLRRNAARMRAAYARVHAGQTPGQQAARAEHATLAARSGRRPRGRPRRYREEAA